ncbi:MAG: hypothetical protein ABIH21_05030 [Patescibacteria group bacterium]
MRILIIDDSAIWIKQGKALLETEGHNVSSIHVTKPNELVSDELPDHLKEALENVDVLLIDKDLGLGITSTRLICVVRHNFPELQIIRWTGGQESIKEEWRLTVLGVSIMDKPSKKKEEKFIIEFGKKLDEQKIVQQGPMGIFSTLAEDRSILSNQPSEFDVKRKQTQLTQLAQIAQLAEKDVVESDDYDRPWTISGRRGEVTKHEFGHAICDGDLTADDIRPLLPALQKVVAKFRTADNIDQRFSITAEFIENGNLDELELVNRCY